MLLGRFTAALRVLIPGLAGMSGLRYRTFLLYNATGGALWATGFVVAGYVAGGSWRRVEHVAGRASPVLLLLAATAIGVVVVARQLGKRRERIVAIADRQWNSPAVTRLRARFERQLTFLGRRVRPGHARGLGLTVSLGSLAALGWIFGSLVQVVVAGDEAARFDRPVLNWFVSHREPWLTSALKVVTALGSSGVVLPVAAIAGLYLRGRRRSTRPLAYLAATYVGAEALFQIVKRLTHRPRPPLHLAVSQFGGYAFPSGHTTLATAVWGAIAITVASATPTWRFKITLYAGATLIAVTVGITRVYLGAHWLTDVLGGWALGSAWLVATSIAFRAWSPASPATNRATIASTVEQR